jgi:hypothetical protein
MFQVTPMFQILGQQTHGCGLNALEAARRELPVAA